MRHHTLVHEVDLIFIERERAKQQQERDAEVEGFRRLPFIRRAQMHRKIRLYTSSIVTQRTQVVKMMVAC